VPVAEMAGAMGDLIAAGKIGGYGVSEWSAAHIREAHAVTPMMAVQTEYSLWSRNAEIAVLDTCRELGITFVAFSPVARGVLANGVRDVAALDERDLRRTMPRFNDAKTGRAIWLVDAFNAIAAREGVTPAQLSLAWVLARGPHIVAIPGTANPGHLAENIAQADWALSPCAGRRTGYAHQPPHRRGAALRRGDASDHRYRGIPLHPPSRGSHAMKTQVAIIGVWPGWAAAGPSAQGGRDRLHHP
jgi:aryl-alcohol dehydrogenase-like predicted oxidoreductase